MTKAVIFDFGGVVHTIGNEKLSALLGPKLNRNVEELRGKVVPLMLSMLAGQTTEEEFWKELGGKAVEVWREQFQSCHLNNSIIELVYRLKERGIMTAVLSNTIPPHVQILRQLGWYNNFDRVFLSCEIGLRKPNPKAYEYVLGQLRISGSESIYIDDTPENLIPAAKLGMRTIQAVKPEQVVADVENMLIVE